MAVMIIYATVEGQTRKVADFVREKLEAIGNDVQTVDASDPMVELSFDGIDRAVLAAPVHERRHPKAFEVLVATNLDVLNQLPTLFLSVSLSAAFDEGLEEAKDYAVEMEMRTGFNPNFRVLVAGAIRSTKYDYYASQVLRHIVLRGREVDTSKSEHEFTDWDALDDTVTDFMAHKLSD